MTVPYLGSVGIALNVADLIELAHTSQKNAMRKALEILEYTNGQVRLWTRIF